MADTIAPGQPGISARWTSSAKSGVGTAASGQSRVWFTVSHGIVNEVYYPRLDQANTRDCGLLVANGSDFFSEEKRDAVSSILPLAQGVPGYQLTNTCVSGRYRIHKTILSDPDHQAVLQRVRFKVTAPRPADYHVYVLLAPHICNRGSGNHAWVGDYKGVPMLFAQRDATALALACSVPFRGMSCGYVGYSDGWQDISAHKRITWFYSQAPDGNVALTADIDWPASANGEFVLALAFGLTPAEAGQEARSALLQDFDAVAHAYVEGWQRMQTRCRDLGRVRETGFDIYRVSTAVLATHESKGVRGGVIASLSIPWGSEKGDDDLGGYHLIWPRDLAEVAGGLLAAGAKEDVHRILHYLQV